ncbi:hypothetical protein D3OALGA1CA_4688 [Olavius algarvensis associated proteobacterium Delta 3]|nr:hypothetical protein D3OALGB2SA_4879 [Olavius algarvensis associated proteobacterium Delta 3]CAB5155336.1 hypothetical protein D3OALGA1CA_4688 [Olavius algarvensis associated proteobacterium Delta 3]
MTVLMPFSKATDAQNGKICSRAVKQSCHGWLIILFGVGIGIGIRIEG